MKTIKLNTMKTIKLLAILFISSLTLVSCSDDDDHDHHDHDHENEVITTLEYTLVNAADSNDVVVMTAYDPDGDGGVDATYEVDGPLTANATYSGSILILNENEEEDMTDDHYNVTIEIKEEADEHEFFYIVNDVDITVKIEDVDSKGYPLGIDTTVTTGESGEGTLTIILKHEPTKPNDGNSDNAGGSTDIEGTFTVTVE